MWPFGYVIPRINGTNWKYFVGSLLLNFLWTITNNLILLSDAMFCHSCVCAISRVANFWPWLKHECILNIYYINSRAININYIKTWVYQGSRAKSQESTNVIRNKKAKILTFTLDPQLLYTLFKHPWRQP